MKSHEFEVEVTVRKRLWVEAGDDRDVALKIVTEAIRGGMGFKSFEKAFEPEVILTPLDQITLTHYEKPHAG